jgi:hypothetical protein
MEKAIEPLFQLWKKRNITPIFCESKKEAQAKILELLPLSASVGLSGSQSLSQLDAAALLEQRGNTVYNQGKPGISREESLELRRLGIQADYFLASANAVARTGELVFFSAFGNRTAGVAFAKKTLVVCGTNKLSATLAEALKRAREYATPRNCKRLDWKSACLESGVCHDDICCAPEYRRMCCQILVLEAEAWAGRLTVMMVGEALGF